MRHIVAGAIVAAVLLAAILVVSLAWNIMVILFGELGSTVVVILVAVVAIVASIVDWLTSKRG